jgi:hypothetical protein
MRRTRLVFQNLVVLLSVLVLTIGLAGCGPTAKFIQTGPVLAAKPDDCPIAVFYTKLPDRDYDELGIIECEGLSGEASVEKVLPTLKQTACQAGGDAVIIKTVQKVENPDDEKIYVTAAVIKWRD